MRDQLWPVQLRERHSGSRHSGSAAGVGSPQSHSGPPAPALFGGAQERVGILMMGNSEKRGPRAISANSLILHLGNSRGAMGLSSGLSFSQQLSGPWRAPTSSGLRAGAAACVLSSCKTRVEERNEKENNRVGRAPGYPHQIHWHSFLTSRFLPVSVRFYPIHSSYQVPRATGI